MIVVINPSGRAGHSFKGLHQYCAHDQGSAHASERVEWIEGRNLASDNPALAWKIMAATAQSQDALKKAAGIKAGRASKNGPVMHVVLSFDKDEPQDREAMSAAADELLAKLGADPAKMRGKSKPKRRQFADEHQVMMYAHKDTENTHLHLMINRVHPETGLNLPSNNDQIKAQKWALSYSKRHGSDHKTPARAENMEARDNGEYVKGTRRKSRNLYEQESQLQAVNDNESAQALRDEQRRKNHALELKGRNMAAMHAKAWDGLAEAHKQRKNAIGRALRREANKVKAAIREEFRPLKRALKEEQASERKTFDALEQSFFGRAGNVVKALHLSKEDVRDQSSGIIKRAFQVFTNAGQRKAYFEQAQQRAQTALEAQMRDKQAEALLSLKKEAQAKLKANRSVFEQARDETSKKQAADKAALQRDWKTRTAEREEALKALLKAQQAEDIKRDYKKAACPATGGSSHDSDSLKNDYLRSMLGHLDDITERDHDNDNSREDGNAR